MPRLPTFLTLLLGLLPAIIWAADPAGDRPPPWRMLIETASPPFSYPDAQGRPTGFAVELMQAAAASQGFTVEFDLRPWQQIYPEFLDGRADVLGLVAYSDERAKRMDFSVSFETLHSTFYIRPGSPPIRHAGELAGRRIGVIESSILDEFVREQNWAATIVRYPTLDACLAATQQGEVDATLSMQFVTDYMIRAQKLDNLERTDFVPSGLAYTLCFAVHPGDKLRLARLNEGLMQVRKSGQYDRLYEKWLGPLEPRRLRWRDVQPYLPPLTVGFVALLGVLFWQRRLLRQVSKQAQSIRENEQRLQLVFEGSQDGFWDWDIPSGRVLRSPRWAAMLGYHLDEVPDGPHGFDNLIHPEDLPLLEADRQRLRQGKDHYSHELRLQAKTGEWRWILDRGKVVDRDPATGAPRRITGTHTDITDRKLAEAAAEQLEQKMRETQKLESLGVLAGGIAHDFNNLLSVVLGNASLARLEATPSTANSARLDSIVAAANRAAELCRQLLAYAGKGSFSIVRLNLNELITETTRLLELSISKQARLDYALAPALPRIEADASQIQQVVMNLVINASEAIGEDNSGTIRIATTVVTMPQPGESDAGLSAEVAPGHYVCLEITDSGNGMPPEVLARIFDPFFTTKFTGRGLGLAAVMGIVRTHHGALRVVSTVGQGSTFRIYLPVSQTQTAHPFPVTV